MFMIPFNDRLKTMTDERRSWLCVGLDMDPEALGTNSIEALRDHTFKVIDATRDLAVAYKPNFAFFERWGAEGFMWLEETVSYIGDDHIKIADAKRGDIGNTAKHYENSIFHHFDFDSVTLNPYMGRDSIEPFLNNAEKGVFILCRTSNLSAMEFQNELIDGIPLYEKVALWANDLNQNGNVGLVVGATAPDELMRIRALTPNLSLLIPGIGAQGGDLNHCITVGNQSGVALINVSRGICFAGDMSEYEIRSAAEEYVNQMREAI